MVTLGLDIDACMRDDKALTDFINGGVGGVWHASGTLRMGRGRRSAGGDRRRRAGCMALEDCVSVDASLMPAIPRANTNTPTIMMAERIADLIKEHAA